MAKEIFISSAKAEIRYNRGLRTLKSWAMRGEILYQVINANSKKPEWIFESPEARYERLMAK